MAAARYRYFIRPPSSGRDCGDLVRRSGYVLRMFRWIAFRNASVEALDAVCAGLPGAGTAPGGPGKSRRKMSAANHSCGIGRRQVRQAAAPEIAQPTAAPGSETMQAPPLRGTGSVPVKYDVSKIGDRGIGDGLNFYSLEREMAMGRELAEQVKLRRGSSPIRW